jgi:isoleucyl-tRNA synthetase
LYTMPVNSVARRSAQTAMLAVVQVMVRALAPILSFTAEEIWQQIPGPKTDSVFLSSNAEIDALLPANGAYRSADSDAMRYLLQLREAVSKVLEPLRAEGRIGAALQAEVTVFGEHPSLAGLDFNDELRFLFISSQLQLQPLNAATDEAVTPEGSTFKVLARVSEHGKCVRCWHYSASVGASADDPELCARCIANINGAGETRRFF